MKLGVIVHFNNDIDAELRKVRELGFGSCQLCCWDTTFMTDENAAIIKECCKKYDIEISTFWCGWNGPGYTDLPRWQSESGGPHRSENR